MANIIIIEKDQRSARQISQFVKELDDRNEFRIFENQEEFYKKYFTTKSDEEAPLDENDGEEETPRLSTIDLIIFNLDCIEGSALKWVEETKKLVHEFRYTPEGEEDYRLKFILTKYEDDGVEKFEFIHPLIDDIIYHPIDRLIFLQKLEIILALPKMASPSFLFLETVLHNIEVSKRSKVTNISSVGFSIENPAPLNQGTVARFYLKVMDKTISFYGKCIESAQVDDKKHNVFFMFFGLAREDFIELKKYLNGRQYKTFKDINDKNFELSDLNMFATDEDKRVKNILVIDPDVGICNSIKENVEENISKTHVAFENSYRSFLKKYVAKAEGLTMEIERAIPNDISVSEISWTIDPDTMDLQKAGGLYEESQLILDKPIIEYFETEQAWQDFFQGEENNQVLEEALSVVKGGQTLKKLIPIEPTEGQKRLFAVVFDKPQGTKSIKIKVHAPSQKIIDEINNVDKKNPLLPNIDLLIINRNMITSDFDRWYESYCNQLISKNLVYTKSDIKIIIIGKDVGEKAKIFADKNVINLHDTPLDFRSLLLSTSHALNTKFSKYCFDNIGWLDFVGHAHVAKAAIMESLSEFGSTLIMPIPITPGTSLFLHGSIFEQAPNRSITARFYHSKEHTTEEGQYACSVIYFGINESFLKYARSWIRENYANKKNK